MGSLGAQLSNQYFTGQPYHDGQIYTVKDYTNTCILKGECPFYHKDVPILSVTVRSGRPSKEAREETDFVTYIFKNDCTPFHFVITNLTSKGPLCVQLFTNDDKPLNEINIIAAGESLIIDSHKINGEYRELICTSHVSFMENIIQRKLTPEETERCAIETKPNLYDSQEKGALVFKLHVYPTDRTLPFFYRSKHYWSFETQFYRKEQLDFHMDGEESDSPDSSKKTFKACHAILNHGKTVPGNSGLKVDMAIHYTYGYRSNILIGVLKEMCNQLVQKSIPNQANKCNQNCSNAGNYFNTILAPCGHLKIYDTGRTITELNCDIGKFCHECGKKIIAVLPKDEIKHLFI
jgi:hypothetical protein